MTKELNYTKGKWFQDKQTGYTIFCDDAQVATVTYSPLPKRSKLANAQLIASAPDLYKACKAQLKWSQELGYPGSILAKEALAKAGKL